jgi:hypothetical protein
MSDHFTLLHRAVQALIATEQNNLRSGIHRPRTHRDPDLKMAEVARQRDGGMDEVYRQIGAIRNSGTDRRFSLETVEARLEELARVCNGLTIWNQLCPKPEPVLPQETAGVWQVGLDPESEAETVLVEVCERVQRALHDVLDLAPDGEQLESISLRDGPAPPNLLYWQAARHELPPRLWAILNCLWGRERIEEEDLVERVWGDEGERVLDGTVRSRLSELNAKLAEIGVPWEYHLRKGYIIKD